MQRLKKQKPITIEILFQKLTLRIIIYYIVNNKQNYRVKMKNSWENTASETALSAATKKLNDFMGVNVSAEMPHDNILKTFPANESHIFSNPEENMALEL